MLRATVLFGMVSLAAVRSFGADTSGPSQLPAERYAAMREKAPFALATKSEPTGPEGTFASNWFVSGIGRLGDNDFATIKSRDLSVQFTLFGHEAHPEHRVSLASVNWSDTVGESTVILQRGTETAKLEFNQAILRSPQPAPDAVASNTAANGVPGGASAARNKASLDSKSTARSATPAVVPAQANRQFSTASRSAGPIQRRIQIIAQPR